MEIKGKLILIGKVENFKNDFKKQNIVIETQEKYPQKIQIEFIKDNIDHLYGLQLGEIITVRFKVKGREYNDKYYTSIEGWRVIREQKKETEIFTNEDESGLPF